MLTDTANAQECFIGPVLRQLSGEDSSCSAVDRSTFEPRIGGAAENRVDSREHRIYTVAWRPVDIERGHREKLQTMSSAMADAMRSGGATVPGSPRGSDPGEGPSRGDIPATRGRSISRKCTSKSSKKEVRITRAAGRRVRDSISPSPARSRSPRRHSPLAGDLGPPGSPRGSIRGVAPYLLPYRPPIPQAHVGIHLAAGQLVSPGSAWLLSLQTLDLTWSLLASPLPTQSSLKAFRT